MSNFSSHDPDGYTGVTFDGKYVYFVPWHNGVHDHGEVLRYDTTSSFNTPSSWSTFDPSKNGIGEDARLYLIRV